MKFLSVQARRVLIATAALFLAYFGLLQIVAHTSVIQQVMSLFPDPGALLVVLVFFALRFACYLVVVPLLLAWGVYGVTSRLLRPRSS